MSRRMVGELTVTKVSVGVPPRVPGAPLRILPPDLAAIAEFTRHTEGGRYRPLSGERSLPSAWEVVLGRALTPEQVIDAVYPLATTHQRQQAAGTIEVVSLDAVLERQSGRYEETAGLSGAGRALAVETLCGVCVRVPLWDGNACSPTDIPCPEPCSVMVALCREAAHWERARPESAPLDAAVPFAAFDLPGNELRERCLSAMIERDG
jgi:hypothetical protein